MRMTFETGRPVSELPFRVVVFGAFAAEGAGLGSAALDARTGGSAPRATPLRVDGGSFDEALKTLAGSLTISLPGAATPVTVVFDGMKSFRPEMIARRLPDGAARLAAREILLALKAKRLNRAEAVKRLEAATLPAALRERLVGVLRGEGSAAGGSPPGVAASEQAPAPDAPPAPPERSAPPALTVPPPRADEPLGGLLSMVDLPGEKTAPGEPDPAKPDRPLADPALAALSSAIGAMARSTGPVTRSDTEAAAAALAGLDAALADQVRAVLQHPDFRRLEAAWRGLRFLVGRVDFRAGVIVEIVPTPAGRPEAALKDLVRSEAESGGGEPVSLAVVADEMPVSPADLARLETLADLAGALGAPIVLAVSRGTAEELAATGVWATFRRRAETAWLGLAVNPFLVRPAYGADSDPVKDFDFSEGPGEELWGSPAWGVALTAARSFARHGWPTHIEGPDGVIEDIPIRPTEQGLLPLQAMLGPDEASRLAAAGFIPLTATWNRDEARILRAPSAREGAWLAVCLARGRLAAFIRKSLDELGASAAPEDVRNHVARVIGRLVPGSVEWRVDLVTDPTGAEAPRLIVKVRSGPPILPAPREMELAFQLGR